DQRTAIEAKAREYGYWCDLATKQEGKYDQRPPGPDPPEYITPELRERRQRDAERKREMRLHQVTETLEDVRSRTETDTRLTPCDQAVLDALLDIAGAKDWCRPSKPAIAERTEAVAGRRYSVGSVKRSLMRLEGFGYFSSNGDGGDSNQTAIRTFLRG